MSSQNARVSLRYRPGPDVLSGQIDLRRPGADRSVTYSPDADSSMEWASDGDGANEYLASFQFVHASARLEGDTLPLPAGLIPKVRSLIDHALESIAEVDHPMAKLQVRAETATDVSVESLRRSEWPERPPGHRCADPHEVADVSSSLARLANAVQKRNPNNGESSSAPVTEKLCHLLNELSSSISNSDGMGAPGTSAATRAAIKEEDMPLKTSEQRILEQALDDLDDPATWHRVPRSLDQLSTALEHSGR